MLLSHLDSCHALIGANIPDPETRTVRMPYRWADGLMASWLNPWTVGRILGTCDELLRAQPETASVR